MSKRVGGQSLTIVIKLGTSSIVHEKTHQPLISLLSGVVETVIRLRTNGHRVVLVSSGAIGVGLKRMNMPERPKHLSGKQALAAVGQGRLIALWDNLFGQLEQPIAQILLTRGDLSDRTRYLNAVNTLTELLGMGVVPIVNENDTVSVSEIKIGDNDTLSAITASMLHADYLFLLTDVEALYTSNPRKDPQARAIDIVSSIPTIRKEVSTTTLGSKLGTGGMETKLIAAEIATAAGVSVIITSSKKPETIFDIIEYNAKTNPPIPLNSSVAPTTSSPKISSPLSTFTARFTPPTSGQALPSERTPNIQQNQNSTTPTITGTNTPIRPPHTLFTPSSTPLRDVKSWTSHTLAPAGSVIIDPGAHSVLSKRESGGRLLPAGVIGVKGSFASGQAVRIMIRILKGPSQSSSSTSTTVGVAELPTLSAEGDSAVLTIRSETTTTVAAGVSNDGLSGGTTPMSEPSTPAILPSYSLSSSVSTLAFLSPSVLPTADPPLPPTMTIPSPIIGTTVPPGGVTAENATSLSPSPSVEQLPAVLSDGDWEVLEVGRGLANYNSVEIMKVKGKKSSQIQQILGYADSEHVVENITIRVPPPPL